MYLSVFEKIKNTFFEYRYAKVKTSHFCTSRSFVNTTMHKVDSILNYVLYNCMYTCNTDFYNLSLLKITSQKKNNWRASVSHRISLPVTTTGGAIQNSRYFFVKKYDTLCWTINIIGKTYILWSYDQFINLKVFIYFLSNYYFFVVKQIV